jgi:quinol monooxygenase YgiN
MTPVAFISHFRIKEGKLDAAKEAFAAVSTQLGASRPRTAAYLAFIDEAGERLSMLHVFPDAEAMDLHAQGAGERSKAAFELFEPTGWEIYGEPSAAALKTIEDMAAEWGVPVKIDREALGGFIRIS